MSAGDSASGSGRQRHLTPAEFEQLVGALADAFDHFGLLQLAQFKLGLDLHDIVPRGSVREEAFGLVQWANREGRLADLVKGALEQNPGNPLLQRFSREVWTQPSVPPPPSPPPSIPAIGGLSPGCVLTIGVTFVVILAVALPMSGGRFFASSKPTPTVTSATATAKAIGVCLDVHDYDVGDPATTTDEVILRESPSSDGEPVTYLPAGTRVQITGDAVDAGLCDWWPVLVTESGLSGFVRAGFLEPSA